MKELLNHTVFTPKIIRILALILALGGLVACGNTTSSTDSTSAPSESTATPAPTSPEPTANSAASDEKNTQTAQIYWLKDTGTKLELAPVEVSVKADANNPDEVLKGAFEQLLSPSSSTEVVNAIPTGTQLKSVAVKGDGIYVDLSSEFAEGGGSAGIVGRLAQVLYTATSLDSTAAVWIRVDGKPLTTIGGEGIEIPQPLTRENFQEQFEL
ncbi:MAG TPA: GerMN domain-containing protein [Oscillatoriales cyanobacterium M4454_W2019_049]|nr:GerMN domain-containing protein [Oscillatoriales cyanobacterium M4454_W2019_049]